MDVFSLLRFAHLINVTYFSDLFAVLTKLVESGVSNVLLLFL